MEQTKEFTINEKIDATVEIANSPEVIKKLESDVSFPQTVKRWQVKRVLYAYCLVCDAVKEFDRRLDSWVKKEGSQYLHQIQGQKK